MDVSLYLALISCSYQQSHEKTHQEWTVPNAKVMQWIQILKDHLFIQGYSRRELRAPTRMGIEGVERNQKLSFTIL